MLPYQGHFNGQILYILQFRFLFFTRGMRLFKLFYYTVKLSTNSRGQSIIGQTLSFFFSSSWSLSLLSVSWVANYKGTRMRMVLQM